MKIALISRRYAPLIGGAEKVLSYLAPALATEGADVTVLTSRLGVEGLPAREVVEIPRGSLAVERLATNSVRVVGTLLYMRRLATRLAELRPDVAYVSMLKHDAYVAVGVGRRLGFPVVLRPEGAGTTGDLAWQRWGRFGRAIGRRCREADAVVTISKAIRTELIEAGYDPSLLVEIPNGVPIPRQVWNRREAWRAAPVAVSIGRLSREKGHDLLIESWPRVRSAFPAARLILVGEGPERSALEGQARRLGLCEAVEFAGFDPEAAGRLAEADLFVLPSREEGMSIALLEAMAKGIPVVATSIPGNRRLVSDFKQGRLCSPEDPASLAEAILWQWSHIDRAAHTGRAARGLIERQYSSTAVARRHLDLFRRLRSVAPRPQSSH